MKTPKFLDFRPTQFSVGMHEVDYKLKKFRKFSKKQLKEYCDDRVIPVVIGPGKQIYLIDHHHFLRACWEADVNWYSVEKIKDLSSLSETAFWKEMKAKGWVYLHDHFGRGPHDPASLPRDIRSMADDPYRSLIWQLIESGHLKEGEIPFYEFKWAEILRQKMKLQLTGKSDLSVAHKKAVSFLKKFGNSL